MRNPQGDVSQAGPSLAVQASHEGLRVFWGHVGLARLSAGMHFRGRCCPLTALVFEQALAAVWPLPCQQAATPTHLSTCHANAAPRLFFDQQMPGPKNVPMLTPPPSCCTLIRSSLLSPQMLGLNNVPQAGDEFTVFETEADARVAGACGLNASRWCVWAQCQQVWPSLSLVCAEQRVHGCETQADARVARAQRCTRAALRCVPPRLRRHSLQVCSIPHSKRALPASCLTAHPALPLMLHPQPRRLRLRGGWSGWLR